MGDRNMHGQWDGDVDISTDPKERDHVYAVLDSFRQYRRVAHLNVTHVRRQNFYALPQAHQDYLSSAPLSMLDTFSKIDDAIDTNADLAEQILVTAAASLGLSIPEEDDPPWTGHADKNNMDKCRSTLNQLFRDWSAEGAPEREACYAPVIRDLGSYLPTTDQKPRILVPGAGLGRLVYELCKAGYEVEGNEISYHQLFASDYILNHRTGPNSIPFHPFLANFSNNITRANQLRKVMIPDEWPGDLHSKDDAVSDSGGNMSMTSGDFCVLYSSKEYAATFDAITTVFFIDTAPNLIRYIETIRDCLRDGGLWINVGPLLWHFDSKRKDGGEEAVDTTEANSMIDDDRGIAEPGSFELSHDEVMLLVKAHGFEIVKEDVGGIGTGYMQDPRSMLQHVYKPVHWVARKKAH